MIRPIEMQMLLPRTESVGANQQHENQSIINSNSHAAKEVAKEVKHNSETVIKKDANAFAEYQYDAKEKGNGTYQNPRRRNKRQNNDEDDFNEQMNEKLGMTDKKQPRINIQI